VNQKMVWDGTKGLEGSANYMDSYVTIQVGGGQHMITVGNAINHGI